MPRLKILSMGVACILALLAACPADIYRSHMSLSQRLFGRSAYQARSDCEADFLACAQACAEDADPRACYHSAVLLERSGYDEFKLSARIGHAVACAHGDPAGCTNRGGGIRNVALDGDALSLLPLGDRAGCLARTFQSSCAAGDAWGCAMSGQAFARGEGVPANEDKAIAAFNRTCVLAGNPTYSSCQFALRLRDDLTGR